jgi:hypothetical protein
MIRKLFHIIKKLLRPIYYSYTGYKVFDLVGKLTGYKKERQRILKSIGYYPNLKNPQSFNEKVLWKKFYDRNPLLPITTDKYKVREYLREVLGEKEAEKILVPLYYVTDKPENIPFDSLPEEYIIKPNHACAMIILAENIEKQKRYTIIDDHKITILSDCKQTRNEIINICKKWLSKPYGFHSYEWAYQSIKRKIVIEKLLRDNCGNIPVNYEFSVFHGKCHSLSVFYNRFYDASSARYTPEWEYLNVRGSLRQADYEKKPENLKSMIDLAELLGKPFDYIRVDLYLVDNQIYFSELTNYFNSGGTLFNPESFDFEFGSKWKVVPWYWKKYKSQ